jgi:hypothetical protein
MEFLMSKKQTTLDEILGTNRKRDTRVRNQKFRSAD